MPLSTLTRLKDELVGLYGEDQVSVFLTLTARKQVDDWSKTGSTKLHNRLFFGQTDPNDPSAIADYSVTFRDLLVQADPAGQHAKTVRARLIVFAFTLWENVYRPEIRRECGVERIDSDEFGDLRHYRNAVLHYKGRLQTDTKALTVFTRGDVIEPTADQLRDVFKQLVFGLNEVGARYYGENPGFEWGRKING